MLLELTFKEKNSPLMQLGLLSCFKQKSACAFWNHTSALYFHCSAILYGTKVEGFEKFCGSSLSMSSHVMRNYAFCMLFLPQEDESHSTNEFLHGMRKLATLQPRCRDRNCGRKFSGRRALTVAKNSHRSRY